MLVLICRSKFKSVVKRADATEDQQIYEQLDGLTDDGDGQGSVSLKGNEEMRLIMAMPFVFKVKLMRLLNNKYFF